MGTTTTTSKFDELTFLLITTSGCHDEPHFTSAIPQARAPRAGGVSRIEMKASCRADGVSRSEMKILNRDNYSRADGVSRNIQNTLPEHTKHTCCCFCRL